MKNTIVFFIGFLLLNSSIQESTKEEARINLNAGDSINIFCSPDLFKLTKTWVSEFCNINHDVKIKVINVAKTSDFENSEIRGNLGFISGNYSALYDESTWNVVVARDIIVPVFNSNNPFVNEICQQGISSEEFAQLFENPKMKNWGTLLKKQKNVPFNLYMIDEESINSKISKLSGIDYSKIDGIKAANGKDLILSVQNDLYSIGICKITNILDLNNQSIPERIKLLPIDRNGNGKIDYVEKIYDDSNIFLRGVWIGKYPKTFFNNLYAISNVQPTNVTEIAFLKWVLTDGQQFLNRYGYSDLLFSERQAKVDLLTDEKFNMITSNENFVALNKVLLILGSLVVMVFLVVPAVRYIKNKKTHIPDKASVTKLVFNRDIVDIPLGLYYDKTHTWAFMEKDGIVRIGIDDFLQHITGPLTRVKMKNTGEKIRKGKPVLSIIQNGKQLNIYSPISGTIKEKNKVLDTNSSIINSSPYSDGWIYKVEPSNWLKEIQFLIIGGKYKEWLQSEFSRLKEFLAVSVKSESVKYSPVLQDGGELKDGILADLEPEVWEDFQTNYIDVSK